ncbi:MAG TPA: serine/threonine-protein kinase [Vicinamibacterales bacterium]|jgi:serine/threonine-protein kinase|nr:serine/threonine-protein kinase [Vicinamibacterales bacterium]
MIESVGQFKILESMPSGPLGDTYRARDTRVGRTVAVTIVADRITSTAERRAQFLEDARRAAALSHPNIVTLYEVGDEESRLYLVYEFVQGQTLRALIGGTPLNPRRAIDLASQIADALAEAHAADVVHGSITSDKVVVTPKGNAKIADAGLAWWGTAAGTARRSREDTGEEWVGKPRPDADLFAVGVLLFEMLTGRVPAPGAGVPSAVNRLLPREIDPIVARAMGKSGGFESAATLGAELRAVGAMIDARKEASPAPVPPSAIARATRSRSDTTVKWLVVVLILGALVAGAWWYFRSA